MCAVYGQFKVVTVRKDHRCYACSGVIKSGERAKTETFQHGRVDGSGKFFETVYWHPECSMDVPLGSWDRANKKPHREEGRR